MPTGQVPASIPLASPLMGRRRPLGLRCTAVLACALLVVVACGSDGEQRSGGGPCGPFTGAPTSESGESDTIDVDERDDWGEVFAEEGVVGTFALREVGASMTAVWDPTRASTPRLPASTFKILNSMIILQTGVLSDVDEVVEWDGVQRSVPEWNRDHSLRTGIEVSAVWAYQELARRVGDDAMASWVDEAGYGNRDIGGGIDQFWLRGDLRISPFEQLDFLERMVTGDLAFDDEVVGQVCEIIVRDQGDGWTWSHKTGTALGEEPPLGWLVGTAENDGRTWVFAMNLDLDGVDGPSGQLDPLVRQRIARTILEAEGALPT